MRTKIATVLSLAAIATALAVPGAAAEGHGGGATVKGSGFGHGVGMSQYGARSMAVKGFTTHEILEHYYEGVRVEDRDVGAKGTHGLRVGLTTQQDAWRLDNDPSSAADLDIWLEGNADGAFAVVRPGDSVQIERLGDGACEVEVGTEVEQAACGDLEVHWPVEEDAPETFVGMPRDRGHGLDLARGWIDFVQGGQDTVHTVLRIHMEDYLYGLSEMPSSWPTETLRAQAVAGRTFALNRFENNPRGASCSCDLLTTVADQHYTGWAKESEGQDGHWGRRWAAAVDATNSPDRTRGEAITYGGALITAAYSSSSPGTTEDSRDIWNPGNDVPYLNPRDDSYAHDADANNPLSTWTREFDYDDFSKRLGFDAVTHVELVDRLRSGNPGVYRVEGWVDGEEDVKQLHTHRDLRGALGLPSHGIWEIDLEMPEHFSDVPVDHPFHTEITWMVDQELTVGYADDTFRPKVGVTRQAAAAFLYRLAGKPSGDYETDFEDVDGDHPFHDEIAWASEMGIVQGFSDGTFRPAQQVSRQAMAAFLANYEFAGDVPAADSSGFEDVDEDHPFHDEIAWMADRGLAGGYDDGTFRPSGGVTRQASAAFLYRYSAE